MVLQTWWLLIAMKLKDISSLHRDYAVCVTCGIDCETDVFWYQESIGCHTMYWVDAVLLSIDVVID